MAVSFWCRCCGGSRRRSVAARCRRWRRVGRVRTAMRRVEPADVAGRRRRRCARRPSGRRGRGRRSRPRSTSARRWTSWARRRSSRARRACGARWRAKARRSPKLRASSAAPPRPAARRTAPARVGDPVDLAAPAAPGSGECRRARSTAARRSASRSAAPAVPPGRSGRRLGGHDRPGRLEPGKAG